LAVLAHQKETKETKAVEVTGKALCFLGYLVFKVFWAIANPHEEKVEPAKKPKDTKNSDRGTVLLLIRVKKIFARCDESRP